MQPLEGYPGGMTSISLATEIEAIKNRLIEMGEPIERVTRSMNDFNDTMEDLGDKPMAPYKVKRAKARKKKRKNGGPR